MPRNHNKLSAKEKLLRAGAVGAIGAIALTGCKGTEQVSATPSTSETTQSETASPSPSTPEFGIADNPPVAEWPEMSEVAKQYRDNATSDKLFEAAKTPGELEKLFTVADTPANRADYAQIWTALDAAEKNAGLNEKDFAELKEANATNDDAATDSILNEKYAAISQTTNSNLNPNYVSNIHRLYNDMAYAAISENVANPTAGKGKNKEYQLNETLLTDTVKTTKGTDGSFSQTFRVEVSDSWDKDLWYQFTSRERDGLDQTIEVSLTDVAPNEQGNLVPGHVEVTDITERSSVGWVEE